MRTTKRFIKPNRSVSVGVPRDVHDKALTDLGRKLGKAHALEMQQMKQQLFEQFGELLATTIEGFPHIDEQFINMLEHEMYSRAAHHKIYWGQVRNPYAALNAARGRFTRELAYTGNKPIKLEPSTRMSAKYRNILMQKAIKIARDHGGFTESFHHELHASGISPSYILSTYGRKADDDASA